MAEDLAGSFPIYPWTFRGVHTIPDFWGIIYQDHFRSGDHLRSSLGVISVQGLFAGLSKPRSKLREKTTEWPRVAKSLFQVHEKT